MTTNCCFGEFLITLVDVRSWRRWEFDGRKPLTLIWESGGSITIKIIRWPSACFCKTRNPQSHQIEQTESSGRICQFANFGKRRGRSGAMCVQSISININRFHAPMLSSLQIEKHIKARNCFAQCYSATNNIASSYKSKNKQLVILAGRWKLPHLMCSSIGKPVQLGREIPEEQIVKGLRAV